VDQVREVDQITEVDPRKGMQFLLFPYKNFFPLRISFSLVD